MATRNWKSVLTLLAAALLAGCTAQDRMIFGDGLAAMTGRGGEVARGDAMPSTRALARELGPQQPKPLWETTFPEESADFATYVGNHRLLVGTVESGAYLGIPDFKDIILYDTTNGTQLWRSARPAIRNGRYSVLATTPTIILGGRGKDELRLLAYDPNKGTKRWERTVASPFRVVTAGSVLVATGFEDNTWTVSALDAATGTVRWETKVATRSKDDKPYKLAVEGGSVLLVSREVHALSLATGAAQWSAAAPWPAFRALDIFRQDDDEVLVGMQGVARLRAGNGALVWRYDAQHTAIRMASVAQGKIFLLRGDGPLLEASSRPRGAFSIECVDLKRGQRLWRYPLSARVTSSLLHINGRLLFATTDRLMALGAKTGKRLFGRTLPTAMVAASPTKATFQGQPDILFPYQGKLILARELYGIAAFSLSNGRRLWYQPHYLAPMTNPYTVNWQLDVFKQTLKQYGFLAKANASSSTPERFDAQQRESLILQSMQRSSDQAMVQAQRELRSRDTTRLGREMAHSSRITSIQSSIIAERMAQNRAAMQATTDLMWAAFDLSDAVGKALKQQAYQGLFERLTMKMNASMAARANAFQGHYYVWPFQERGRGFTLIDLNTGKRNDLIFSPMVPPLTDYGVDLPTYAINPADNRFITFGVSLDAAHYSSYVKWKWRIPRSATIAYDLKKIKFSTKSRTEKYWQQDLKTDLVEWASRGDAAKVEELLSHGVNVNQEKYTVTPLWVAIARRHDNIVRILIAHGANVNWEHTFMKLKPLQLAKNVHASPQVIKMLEQAGATE